jgi:hypothetical protein
MDQLADARLQHFNWQQFAVDQVRAGHFPLWNPYSFCGTPFFADPQSAMLYPPNWLYLALMPQTATSWLIAAHFFLVGYLAGLFCRSRGLSVQAALLCGVLFACCGPLMTNLRPGHLSLIYSAAWLPLLLCSVQNVFSGDARRRLGWTLAGIAAVAMLALDGYPQMLYYSALTAGLYALLLPAEKRRRWPALLAVAVMFAGGAAISAVQLLAAAQFKTESIRSAGLDYATASTFFLPPENLLTLFIPGIFGDDAHVTYFGRYFWWEACVYIGTGALGLAAYEAMHRRARHLLAMAILLMILALGASLPVYSILYRWLPGYGNFRGTNRLGLVALLFIAVLAAMGFDRLQNKDEPPRPRRAIAWLMIAAGVMFGVLALWAALTEKDGPGAISAMMQAFHRSGQSDALLGLINPSFPKQSAAFTTEQLIQAAAGSFLAGLFWMGMAQHPEKRRWTMAAALLAGAQVIFFAAGQRINTDHQPVFEPNWRAALTAVKGDDRVLIGPAWPAEAGGVMGFKNIVGYNPLILGRTARYLAAVAGINTANVQSNYPRVDSLRAFRMLRCRLMMNWSGLWSIQYTPDPLPQLVLIQHCTAAGSAQGALDAVLNKSFDPANEVVLETPPMPAPDAMNPASPSGSARLLSQTTDELEIEADLPSAQILLVTDAYSTGWHATGLSGESQSQFAVLPADYCLRGIPLAAGHHHLLLAYRPAAFVIGKWISLFALGMYAIALAGWFSVFRRRSSPRPAR